MPDKIPEIDDYIESLNLAKMRGRMLRLPAPPKRKNSEILIIYGRCSSIERWWSLARLLNRYGAVTMPDLPGFGGMASLYTIGQKPTIDRLADYLATFIRWRYKRKKVVIVGVSFGMVIVTRLLQKYPELRSKVKLVISVGGYAHYSDFKLTPSHRKWYYWGASLAERLPFPRPLGQAVFNQLLLKPVFARVFVGVNDETRFKTLMSEEVRLWRRNDPRTWLRTSGELLKLDNCHQPVDLPLWHIFDKASDNFDEYRVEQHLRVIFQDFEGARANLDLASFGLDQTTKPATVRRLPPKLRQKLDRI